jgi:hypothetical protein
MNSIGLGKSLWSTEYRVLTLRTLCTVTAAQNQLPCHRYPGHANHRVRLTVMAAGTLLPNLDGGPVPQTRVLGMSSNMKRSGDRVAAPTWASDRQRYQLRYSMYVTASLRDDSIDTRDIAAVPVGTLRGI